MGNAFYSPHNISEEAMEDYLQLTYLTQNEIFRNILRAVENLFFRTYINLGPEKPKLFHWALKTKAGNFLDRGSAIAVDSTYLFLSLGHDGEIWVLRFADPDRIYKRLTFLQDGIIQQNIKHRFAWADIVTVFPELRMNPFEDRLTCVFSSEGDTRMSFEDMLDLCSTLSPQCSPQCKAQWALKLFDFNGSNSLEIEDISKIIDRLTSGLTKDPSKCLTTAEKEKIAKVILHEIDLDHTGSIVSVEFVHAVSKIPDFCSSFTLRL